MVVHLLAVPNTRTTRAYELDGFCLRTMLFAALLKRLGHSVVLYGVIENEAPCDAFVSCVGPGEYAGFVGSTPYQDVPFEESSPLFVTFNTRASNHIRTIKGARDVIATIAGSAHRIVAENHPELRMVEYSVGYRGVYAPYRVYQSQAWRHFVLGATGVDGGRPFDHVIPPWFDVETFPYAASPDDYVIFCGRLVENKGIGMACRAAQAAGVRLVVIGHGNPALVTYGEYLGAVSHGERNRLLSNARACLMPTHYLEPFGNVSAEAQLCGTPVISTDSGGFTESVEHGVSGYRCVTLGEYRTSIDQCRFLDRAAIRARAERLYGVPAADAAYRTYFDRLACVGGVGVDSLSSSLEGVL